MGNEPKPAARPCAQRWTLDGVAVYRARVAANLTQGDLAVRCGWSRAYVSRLEGSQTTTVSWPTIKKLKAALPNLVVSHTIDAARLT